MSIENDIIVEVARALFLEKANVERVGTTGFSISQRTRKAQWDNDCLVIANNLQRVFSEFNRTTFLEICEYGAKTIPSGKQVLR